MASSLDHFCFRHLYFFGFFVLQLNVLYRLYEALTSFKIKQPKSPAEDHTKKRERVQEQVRKWNEGGRTKKMCTGRPKSHSIMMTQPNYRDTLHRIKMDDLTDIISLDTERRVVKVEPLVNMGQLMAYLIPQGWTLPVVPEIEALTVGGLIMGGGLQTSSHKYGLFHRICRSFELVVSSGEALTCSKEENSHLYQGIPVSYGTLGFLTAVEINLVKATRYVKVEYQPAHNFEEGRSIMERESRDQTNDFVEGIIFNRNEWVIMRGKMVNSAPSDKVNHVTRWYKPWFYKHVENALASGFTYEYIPLMDYYFRHSRCTFWHSTRLVPYGNHPIFRYLFGWTLPLNIRFLKKIQPQVTNEFMFVQDFLVRPRIITDIVSESDRLSKFYPIWVCPVMFDIDSILTSRDPESGQLKDGDLLHFDIGFYGLPSMPNFNSPYVTRELEIVTMKNQGYRALYTDTFMSKEEIGKMFNLREYNLLRQKYQAEEAFPDLFSKISMKARKEGL